MADVHLLFREYTHLDRKRTGDGLTPREFDRWRLLARELARRFSKGRPGGGSERRESVRVPTRLKVAFESRDQVVQALMTNLSRGGLFINTALPPEPGTRFDLKLQIEASGETLEIPSEVVSVHVGSGFSTGEMGMGVRFLNMSEELRKKVDDLYESLTQRSREPEPEDA